MLTLTEQRDRATAAARVMDYLRRQHLEPDDLLRFGGQDLSSPDVRVRDKARAVERGWALLAELHLKFEDFAAVVALRGDGWRPGMGADHNINSAI